MNPYHNETGFSVHTFEIRLLNGHKADYYRSFANAFNFCKKHNKSMYNPNKRNKKCGELVLDVDVANALNDSHVGNGIVNDVYVCEALSAIGMTITFVRTRKFGEPVDYDIRAVINPRRIIGYDTYVGIMDIDRVDDMLLAIYTAFEFIGSEHLYLDFFRLHRIDLCRNVFVDNRETVKTYLGILKKCFIPSGYRWNEVDGVEHGMKLKDGVTISTDTLAINAYNKEAYMNSQKGYYAPVYIAEAEGLIRFEIKLYAPRINYLYGKDNGLNSLLDFFHNCERISREHFEKYIPKVFLRGNYFTLEDAKRIVEQSDYYEPTKKKMLMLLNRISVHRNLMVALDEVIKAHNPSNPYTFTHNLLKNFDDIDLNPVTVPRRRLEPGEVFLPGVYNQVMGIEALMFSILE